MTVTQDGVRFEHGMRRSVVIFFIVCVEVILSFLVYVSLTANLIWPEKSRAATGVASVLAYEGRLMDATGNPLGGTGEPYCFRFSIYDAASAGSKLWPSGTPATSTATTTDGVFNALVGQADVLDYNFYGSDTTFLNVDVYTATSTNGINCTGGTWETLAPRQRIAATGYARSAENVYSSLFSTDVTGGIVHIGTGAGVPGTPKFLGLDVKSAIEYIGQSCVTSGTVWYNSAISKALVCENGFIQTIGNSSATTTIAAFTANAGAAATTGTIIFSNGNGVTFGINGNTITAAVNGIQTYSTTNFAHARGGISSGSMGQNSLYILPQTLTAQVSGSLIRMPVMVTNSSSGFAAHTRGYTAEFGVYTRNATNATVLSRHYSTSYTASFSANSNQTWNIAIVTAIGNSTSYNTVTASSGGLNLSSSMHGPRYMIFPLQSLFTTGEYWFAFRNSSSSAGAAGNLFNISHLIATHQTQSPFGVITAATNAHIFRDQGLGTYSATTGALPAGISMTQINPLNSTPIFYFMNGSS